MEKKKILIVDDEERFGRMLKLVLDATGRYEVEIQTTGKGALMAVRTFQPNLVFLDISLPDMDGAEVVEKLKEDPRFKTLPIIFLTGMVLKAETGPNSKSGGYPVIAKPVSADELIKAIEKNLKR